MPADAFRPGPFHANRPGLVAPVRADPLGLAGPPRGAARGPRWRRTSKGLYVPSDVDGTLPDQRAVEAAAVLPSYGGVTGWAALHWLGGRWFEGGCDGGRALRPVTLAVGGQNIWLRRNIRLSKERLEPADLMTIDGLRLTTAVRSACFEMRYADGLRAAVRVMEMAAYSDLVSIEEMWAYVDRHAGWTGVPLCREALELADENVWSPTETDMKLVWKLDAGLPRPLCNVPIFDLNGRHVATPDLFDPVAGVVGEYDGSLHLQSSQRWRDVKREEMFRRLDLEYFTMLAGDRHDHTGMAARMISTRARAKWLPPGQRAWTLDPPYWWTPTLTVDQRRALTESQREKLLANRAG